MVGAKALWMAAYCEGRVVRVHFEDALNPKESITGFNLYSDGLPHAYTL